MSATRQPVRSGADIYPTPEWATEAILDRLADPMKLVTSILEPACGDGRILRQIIRRNPERIATGIDIRGEVMESVHSCGEYVNFCRGDFLAMKPDPRHSMVITNPPFSLALPFVQRSLEWLFPHDDALAVFQGDAYFAAHFGADVPATPPGEASPSFLSQLLQNKAP